MRTTSQLLFLRRVFGFADDSPMYDHHDKLILVADLSMEWARKMSRNPKWRLTLPGDAPSVAALQKAMEGIQIESSKS